MTTDRPDRRVLGVVGSLRRESFNRRLLGAAETLAPERLRITVAPDLIRLPLFDQDLVSLAVIGAHVLPSPPVLVSEATTRFDGDRLVDEMSVKVLGLALSRFLGLIDALTPAEVEDA